VSGQLVGEVLNARQAGDLSDLSQGELPALLTIADGCYTGDRRGPVPMDRIAAAMGKTPRTAGRAIERLKGRKLIGIVKPGYKSHGSGHATDYELAVLRTSRVSAAHEYTQDTESVRCTGDVHRTNPDVHRTFQAGASDISEGASDTHGWVLRTELLLSRLMPRALDPGDPHQLKAWEGCRRLLEQQARFFGLTAAAD
jgi:hypothetical protein